MGPEAWPGLGMKDVQAATSSQSIPLYGKGRNGGGLHGLYPLKVVVISNYCALSSAHDVWTGGPHCKDVYLAACAFICTIPGLASVTLGNRIVSLLRF